MLKVINQDKVQVKLILKLKVVPKMLKVKANPKPNFDPNNVKVINQKNLNLFLNQT